MRIHKAKIMLENVQIKKEGPYLLNRNAYDGEVFNKEPVEIKKEENADEDVYEEYVVETIHGERLEGSMRQYLVEWENFPEGDDWTWEPENMLHTPEGEPYLALKDFRAALKDFRAWKEDQKGHMTDTTNDPPPRKRRRR